MNQSRLLGTVCAYSLLLTCTVNISHAATTVVDTFDVDTGTWGPNTTETNVGHSATGGNPDGYMTTDNRNTTGSFHAIGATNTSPNYSGVFADGIWTVSVDLSFEKGDFTDAWLRFRFQDPTANGWHISLEDSDFLRPWQSYSVTFDTTWDDATAIANGWVQEDDGTTPTPSFSDLWHDVYTSEIRLLGNPDPLVDPKLIAGIDNYSATVVPVPATIWLFGSGLLGLIGISRRNNTI